MTTDYQLCGWRLRSEIPLPGSKVLSEGDALPDVVVRYGSVAAPDPEAQRVFPGLVVFNNDECCLDVPKSGRFLIRRGREVVVEPYPDATDSDVRLFLLGTVFGVLCHQRQLYPLHAACLKIGDAAIAICGDSGRGKSTLAAALVSRGHTMLTDDVTVIDLAAGAKPLVWPALPRIRLWRQSLEAMGLDAAPLEQDRIQLDKYLWPVSDQAFCQEPVALSGIVVLEWQDDAVPVLKPVPLLQSVVTLGEQVYRRRAALALGRAQALLTDAGRIAAATPVKRLYRSRDLNALHLGAELLEAWAKSLSAGV